MNISILGFNGMRPDPISGVTHLGNGYRTYSPVLQRFTAPDSWSPFGAGAINPYAYCDNDPINRADPSGHFSLGQWIGVGLGLVAGITLSIVTEGAAMPAVLSLMATVTGDSVIGAGIELVTEAVDGHKINWGMVGITAGISAVAILAGYGLGIASKLKGTSNRPFGGLMMTGAEGSAVPFTRQRTFLGISHDLVGFTYSESRNGVNVISLYGHVAETPSRAHYYYLNNNVLNASEIQTLLKRNVQSYAHSESIRLDFCFGSETAKELSRLEPGKYIGGAGGIAYVKRAMPEAMAVEKETINMYRNTVGTEENKLARASEYFMTSAAPDADFSIDYSTNNSLYSWYRNGERIAQNEFASMRRGMPYFDSD